MYNVRLVQWLAADPFPCVWAVVQVLDEWRPRFQAAKNVLRDRKRRMERIVGDALPLPPGRLRGPVTV